MRLRHILFIIGLVAVIISGSVLKSGAAYAAQIPASPLTDPSQVAETCREVLARAFDAMGESCASAGRNTACFGNNKLKVEPRNATVAVKFDTRGDLVPVQRIKSLTAFPFNSADNTWGLSLLKLQVNLPDSLPGQNVVFIVYGDTQLDNPTGDMKAFSFSTGLGSPTCKEMPNGILVRSPKDQQVSFSANGVQINIGSTVLLQTDTNRAMIVTLIEGSATLSSFGRSTTLKPMESATVPLGGPNGFQAVGMPSAPQPAAISPLLTEVTNKVEQLYPKIADQAKKPDNTKPDPASKTNNGKGTNDVVSSANESSLGSTLGNGNNGNGNNGNGNGNNGNGNGNNGNGNGNNGNGNGNNGNGNGNNGNGNNGNGNGNNGNGNNGNGNGNGNGNNGNGNGNNGNGNGNGNGK